MKNPVLLVLCSCPSQEVADKIAQSLVKERLAACVNIVPGICSIFPWKGKIDSEEELLLLIKTTEQVYPKLEAAIEAQHPYEIAEIIALPIQQGAFEYLNWVQENTCKN